MAERYELNLRDYIRILRKQRFIVFSTFIIVFLLSIFYVSRQKTIYEASAVVKVEERKTIAGLLTEWILYNPADLMESYTKAVNSFDVLKLSALRLGLIKENSSLEQITDAVSKIAGSISVERIGNSNMIKITATADTPQEAMEIARAVSEAFQEYNLLEKTKQFRHARQFIEEQLASIEKRLLETEERLRQFGDEVKGVKLAEPIEKKLTELQFELAELLQKYTEKHPKVIQLRSQIEDLENQVKGFSADALEYARLQREVEVNKKLYAMLKEKLEEARITEAERVSDVSIVSPAVMPGVPLTSNKRIGILVGIILGLVLGSAFAFMKESLDTSISTIHEVEEYIKLPVLGVVPSIGIKDEDKNKTFFNKFKERFFAPEKTDLEKRKVALISHYEPDSVEAEAFRNIYTNIKVSSLRKTILITSSNISEGKTTMVSNLGIVMAQSGLRVLLVSADLRRPYLHKIFGIENKPGITELVLGTVDLEQAMKGISDFLLGKFGFEDIRKTPGIENIWLLCAGQHPLNPIEILESKEFKSIMERLKSRFDVIIFDAPPVLPVADTNVLASLADACIIVYETGRTSREALLRAKVQLENVGAKILGVILNNTKPQTESLVTPYYKYKYKYYTKSSSEEK